MYRRMHHNCCLCCQGMICVMAAVCRARRDRDLLAFRVS